MTDFLTLYIVAAAAAVAVSLLLRRRILSGRRADQPADLGAYEIAYLTGGTDQAVVATLTALYRQGVIGTSTGKTLVTNSPLPDGSHPLEQTIHEAVSAGRATTGRRLVSDFRVDRTVTALAFALARAGFVIPRSARRRVRRATWPILAVLVVGMVRLLFDFDAGRPVGYLALAVVATGAIWATLVRWKVPTITARARETLRTTRLEQRHLAPDANPAWETYGPAGAALGVAMFGTAALWTADPSFADELDMEPYKSSIGGGYFRSRAASCGSTSGYSSACGGTSSCGGGSSCGGTSSCGGGGGCGGGGT